MAAQFDYAKMGATASRLMERFRQGEVTVQRKTTEDTRPVDLPIWEPWTPEETVRQYRLDATVRVVEFKYIDKENIRATDQQVTCSDKMTLYAVDGVVVDEAEAEEVAFDVDLMNTLVIDGVSMTVLQKIPTPGAGVKIVHKFIVRGGAMAEPVVDLLGIPLLDFSDADNSMYIGQVT